MYVPQARCSNPSGDWNGISSPQSVMPNESCEPPYVPFATGVPDDGWSALGVGPRSAAGTGTGAEGTVAAVTSCAEIANVRSLPPVLRTVITLSVVSPVRRSARSESGETAMSGATRPSPRRCTLTDGRWGSLLEITSVLSNTPSVVGANDTNSVRPSPGARSNAAAGAPNGATASTLLTCSTSVPVFCTWTVSVRTSPTNRLPYSIESRDTAMAGRPVT